MSEQINGAVLVGAQECRPSGSFHAIEAVSGQVMQPAFCEAGASEVDAACALAAAAFPVFSELAPDARARFLEAAAAAVESLGDTLIVRAMAESGLPRARLEGELVRTVRQLQLFAQVARAGEWIDATIDSAQPQRTPVPRPDLRRRQVALGPVVVFGASNFPLAFSVAGGDTASALAAGCPVVVKGHRAHPGTGELVARALRRAVDSCGLPPGVFSYLPGTTHALGAALVADARIHAVGFTGSRAGGKALMAVSAARQVPIPVYAEMSAINPVILLPAAARARGAELARAYAASLSMGAGQFCTNPGLLLAIDGPDLENFLGAAGAAVQAIAPQPMLTDGILQSYRSGVAALAANPAVTRVGQGQGAAEERLASAALFATQAAAFNADPALSAEVFGASSLIVRARDGAELEQLIDGLEGQLTATLLFDAEDEPLAARLLPLLERRVGRVLANGWPTGVEVCHAMVHGGPYPATSDARSTSVGTLAIQRFLRPVCYQNLPDSLLPPALRAANPWKLPRRVDGVRQNAP